jgi:SnoaL-like domain
MVGLAWLFACGTSRKAVAPMSDGRVKVYERYLSSWSAVTDDERSERLQGSLSSSVVFYNPTKTRRGRAEVAEACAEFQKRTPGGSFVADEMLAFESHGIVKWRLLDAQGKPGALDIYGFDYGYDVLEFNADGHIESIMMFVHMKAAILK